VATGFAVPAVTNVPYAFLNGSVAHFAHLGDLAEGFLMMRYWKNGVNFKGAGRNLFDATQRPRLIDQSPQGTGANPI